VPRHAPVRVHDDLAPGQAGIRLRAALDEAAGGVDVDLRIAVDQVVGNDGADYLRAQVGGQRLVVHLGIVLRGNDQRTRTRR
jgi:hypothetical protein